MFATCKNASLVCDDLKLVAGGYALPDILGLNSYSFSRMEKLGHLISSSYREIIVFTLVASLLWLASWLSFSERSGARMSGAGIGLAIAVMGMAMVTGLYSLPIVWGQFHEILLGVMFFGLTLATFALGCRHLLKRGVSKLALAVCFAIFPFVFAFGSNNDYLSVGSRAGIFWIASCILVLSAMSLTRLSWRVLLPLSVGAQALAILVFLVAMEYPFRQPQSLRQNEAVVRVGRTGSELVLSHEVAKYIGEFDQLLKNGGFLQGDPMIDLTGRSPGVLFLVGARSIGWPWLSGGYKGSANLAFAALDRESCNELARMWVLTEPTGPRNIQSEILQRYGLDLKRDFTDLGKLSSPAGSYLGGHEQHVLKPHHRPEEVRVKCEQRRAV